MTLRNRNRNRNRNRTRSQKRSLSPHQHPWRRHDDTPYRHARLQRSLARLRSHPAVNPMGPHGPHGRVSSCPSIASSCPTYPTSHSSTPKPLPRNSPQSSDCVAPGIIRTLFNDLVHRQLGFHPSNSRSTNSLPLNDYLDAARAVTSSPSLSDPHFVARLATGNEPTRLADRNLLASLPSKPVPLTIQSQRVRDIHLAIRNASLKRINPAAEMKKANTSTDSPHLRRSTRKRLRSANDSVTSSLQQSAEKSAISNPQSGELAAFRPTPETVRITRSEAARARRSSTNKTPSECCFCPDPQNFEDEEIQSELIGPFVDRRGNAKLFVHFDCACWAPQVYTDPANGQLRRVYDEYCRGRKLKCSSCGEKGATIGCYIQRCKKVFHYRCLEPAKAYCVERFFAAFCETHAHQGRKPSYKILMEAATIADVSAAQRREDTTYGLDAPHSRYTMLRRRETEIIFSRKWRVSSHSGAFDTGKVIFSHRRKAVLGKTDRLSVGDCVRVLRTSALDIASGRLAFMTLAQKDEANDDVTAVEARAAIASRESTGLLLLRNLRKARQWGADEIEVVRSIPMESKPSQSVPTRRSDVDSESQTKTQEHWNIPREDGVPTSMGKKRPGLQESGASDLNPDRKRQRISAENGGSNDVKSSKTDPSSKTSPSVRLPSFDKSKTRQDVTRMDEQRSVSASQFLTQMASDEDTLLDPSGPAKEPSQEEYDKSRLPKDPSSKPPFSSQDLPTVTQKLTCQNDGSAKSRDFTSQQVIRDESGKQGVSENQKARVKVKSAWETFLEEQLPRERLLRPDDSMADSLRNMARLWSLMTPAQRSAYEMRGRMASVAASYRGSQATCTAQPKAASIENAGLFSGSQKSHARTQSGLKLHIKKKEPSAKRQPSVSLSALKDGRRDERIQLTQNEQLNWDNLFPTTLESDLCSTGGRKSPQREGKQVPVHRVRAPPTRGKAGS